MIQAQIDKLRAADTAGEGVEQAAPYTPLKEEIVYDDFAKLDFRMGTIKVAESKPYGE